MVKPGDPDWHSSVGTPIVLDADAATFDDEADLLVVGFGGAGVVAALQGAELGADVLALDRFAGGGATAISGGVVYAGATPYQAEVGYDDTVEQMYRYLKLETDGVVSDETLRGFCEASAGDLAWLERHGVPFEASLCPVKTSYPTNEHYLYFSGNESIAEYAAVAKPAPRGHRAKGRGLPGASLYEPLRRAAEGMGVRVRYHTAAERLLVDAEGRVLGVEVREVPEGWARTRHRFWSRLGLTVRNYAPRLGKACHARCEAIEHDSGRLLRIRADAVVLAAGGFIFNRRMVEQYAPAYRAGMPLGTPGCSGSGIRLGQSVGGAVDRMARVSAWRFINPPLAWARGIFVNAKGERYCNEAVYGAKLGQAMVEQQGGVGILVINEELRRQAFQQLAPGNAQWFQQAPGVMNMLANSRKAPTIEELARAIRAEPTILAATLRSYNEAIATGQPDPLGKPDSFRQAMLEGPFYAMNCGLASKRFPCPTLTLGGLVIEERTGAVKRGDGTVVAGLFAAGRTAVGVASSNYVSGLSIADCVFSGRRAARSAIGST